MAPGRDHPGASASPDGDRPGERWRRQAGTRRNCLVGADVPQSADAGGRVHGKGARVTQLPGAAGPSRAAPAPEENPDRDDRLRTGDRGDDRHTDPGPRVDHVEASPMVTAGPGGPDPANPATVLGDGHGPVPSRAAPGERDDPRLRLSRGVLVSGRYLLTRRLHHDRVHEIWQAVDQTLVRDVRLIVIEAHDSRAQAVLAGARRAAMVRDQHFLRVFDADRATVADLTRVWRPGEQGSMRVHPAGSGRSPVAEDAPGLSAPLVYVVEEWVSAQPLETLLQRSPLPTRQAVVLALELATALTAAHAQGMPHGFVGPDRVLVTSTGSVRISGLRSAAVLATRTPAPPDSPAAREQDATDAAADVRSIGAVLYAALTARWPLGGDTDAPTESLWRWSPGAAATVESETTQHLRAAPRAHGRVLAPRQVRPGIPRRLDELVLRLLGHPVGDHPPVRTPGEAAELIERQLDATTERGVGLPVLRDLADLRPLTSRRAPAARTAAPLPVPAPVPVPDSTAAAGGAAVAAAAAVEDRGQRTAVVDDPTPPAAGQGPAAGNPDGARSDGAAGYGAAGYGAAGYGGAAPGGRAAVATRQRTAPLAWQGAQSRVDAGGSGPGLPGEPVGRVPGDRRAPDLRLNPPTPPPRRLRPALVVVVVVALIAAATALVVEAKRTLSGQPSNPAPLRSSAGASGSPTSRPGRSATTGPTSVGGPDVATGQQVVLPIVGAVDFDPVADGGNGSENPAEVGLAIDGNPTTAWHTVTYYGRADLGGLKPGVGLVVDLGQIRKIRSVVVGLTGTGTSLDLETTTDELRPDSLTGFTEVADATRAGSQVTLTAPGPVRARWVLLWLTSLPQVGAGQYQGGISSITVRGPRGT
jgi:hypothetical protein